MSEQPTTFDAWLCKVTTKEGADTFRLSVGPHGAQPPAPGAHCLGTNLSREDLERLINETARDLPAVEVDDAPEAS